MRVTKHGGCASDETVGHFERVTLPRALTCVHYDPRDSRSVSLTVSVPYLLWFGAWLPFGAHFDPKLLTLNHLKGHGTIMLITSQPSRPLALKRNTSGTVLLYRLLQPQPFTKGGKLFHTACRVTVEGHTPVRHIRAESLTRVEGAHICGKCSTYLPAWRDTGSLCHNPECENNYGV